MKTLASVVEGHGEVLALPLLLRRIAEDVDPGSPCSAPTPWRLPRGRFRVPGDLENAVAVVSRRVTGGGGVIVLLDADDDCPVTLSTELAGRANAAAAVGCPVAVVVVQREFEAWFLASLPSLGSHPDVTSGLASVQDAEMVRDAKGRLHEAMTSAKYSETRHQPAFAAAMDLEQARECRSFRKFDKEVRALLGGG